MVTNPFDHAEANRLDRALDALVTGGSAEPDPSLQPFLRLMAANQPRPLATDARQRIWAQIAGATDEISAPADAVQPGGSMMAAQPRIVGERERTPRRELGRSRWRPALEIAAVAILLLTLAGGLMNRQRHQPPTLSALMASPSAATSASTTAPTSPYNMELVLQLKPSRGQAVTPDLLRNETQVLIRRAQSLGIPVLSAGPLHGEVHLQLSHVNYPPSFVEQVFSQTGLFEVIATQGKYILPGTLVKTTQGSPFGTPVVGPVYTTIISSREIIDAETTTAPNGPTFVNYTLTNAAGATVESYSRAHIGASIANVLDNRVIDDANISGVATIYGGLDTVNPPVVGLVPPTTTLPPNPNWPAANALVAMLKSGPLPVPVAVASNLVVPSDQSLPGAPVLGTPVATAIATPRTRALNPNSIEITLQVDAEGVRNGEPLAVVQALQQLHDKLDVYQSLCRVGAVFTTGAGDIGPGNELANAIDDLLKGNFPQLIDAHTVFRHYAQPSLPTGTVQIDLYFFENCLIQSGATLGPMSTGTQSGVVPSYAESDLATAVSLNPNAVEMTLHVDAAGVINDDPAATKQALQQLQTKLSGYVPLCGVGLILTTGAGDIGPGNELASAINQLLQQNFQQLVGQHAVFKHYAQPSLSPGTVNIDLYLFNVCPAPFATPTGSPIVAPGTPAPAPEH